MTRVIAIEKDMKDIRLKVNQKIDWKNFWQIIGFQTLILVGLSGYIASQIHDLQQLTQNTAVSVAVTETNVQNIADRIKEADLSVEQ